MAITNYNQQLPRGTAQIRALAPAPALAAPVLAAPVLPAPAPMPAMPGGFGGFGAGGASAQAGAGSGGGGGLLASLFGGGAPAAAGAGGGGGGGILGGMNMGQIKNIIDRMGGINGIMDGIGKAQKFMGTMQQFAPMAKVLLGAFAGKKTAEAEEDELEGIPRRRRRRRRRRSSGRRRTTKGLSKKHRGRLRKRVSSRPKYGVRKHRKIGKIR